jgi:hypothetical protein
MTELVRSYCRICQAHCGIVVELDGQQVVKVAGDKDHPVSRGYTCSKGRSLGEMHHDPDRLERPELGGVPSSWDAVLGDLAGRLNELVAADGPDTVACYKSTGWVLDTAARSVADRWMRALGTRQLYSPATIDTPNRMLVPDLVVGAPFIQPVTDWERSELLVIFGHNLVVSHGHATSVPDPVRRLRAVQERGGAIIVADPRRTETAQLADVHLQLLPGSDAALAAFFVRHRLATLVDDAYLTECVEAGSVERLRAAVAPFDRDATARHCGLDVADLDRAVALLDRVARLSYVSGTGVSMGPAANATEWLGWALAAVTGSLDRDGGMLFNPGVIRPQSEAGPATMPRVTGPPPATHPELQHAYGEYPTAILCDEILDGNVRALVSFGGNPLGSFPDTPKTLEALRSLDVLVVAELRRTPMTAIATHTFATCDQLERHDATFFLDQAFPFPFAQYTAPVVAPVGDRRPLWAAMAELSERMGIDLPALHGIDDEVQLVRSIVKRSRVSFDELAAAPSGVVVDGLPRSGWLIPDRVPRGRLDVAPELPAAAAPDERRPAGAGVAAAGPVPDAPHQRPRCRRPRHRRRRRRRRRQRVRLDRGRRRGVRSHPRRRGLVAACLGLPVGEQPHDVLRPRPAHRHAPLHGAARRGLPPARHHEAGRPRMSDGSGALYERDGDRFVATAVTANGWGETHQSGGAVLALLGHLLEDVPTLGTLSLSRLTADFVRPLAIGSPLAVELEVIRDGAKIQLVDAVVVEGEHVSVRARMLRTRTADVTAVADLPPSTTAVDPAGALEPPESLADMKDWAYFSRFLSEGVELRRTQAPVGGVHGLWVRMRGPVVDGEPIRATSRVALPMDCMNMLGVDVSERLSVTALNPDVTGHVLRPLDGEWVALTGNTFFAHDLGRGLSAGTLSDRLGPFGVASTSQILQPL